VTLPAGLQLTVEHPPGAGGPEAHARRWLELLGVLDSGPLTGWELGPMTERDPGPGTRAQGTQEGELLPALAAAERVGSFTLRTGAGARVTVTAHPDGDPWTAYCRAPATETDERVLARWLAGAIDVLRRLFADGQVATAVLSRPPPAHAQVIPGPPVARWNHAVVTDDTEVAAGYLHPEVFWGAWDGQERGTDRHLLWRAVDAVHDEDWADEVLADQLDLARAARPGLTRWPHPDDDDWDRGLLTPPEHRLEVVGYLPDEQVLELAGYFGPGEHVPLSDVYTVRSLTEAGRTTDGRPLRAVRVFFPDADMAAREAVPLLDAGAEVWYEDAAAGRRPLELPTG
jgi:hypothetical protein